MADGHHEPADEFINKTIEILKTDKGVHIETAIAATARMAGTFLFRSFGFNLADAKPGQPVLSEIANEKGPELVNVVGAVLARNGIHIADLPEADSEHDPHLGFLESQRRMEPEYEIIRKRFGLSLDEAAKAAAAATGELIVQGSSVLDPSIAFGIAVYGFIEGSKTVPAEVGESSSPTS